MEKNWFLGRDDNVETKEIRKHSLSNNDIISLWNTVRFPLLTKEFFKTIVISSDQFIPYISKTESFSVAAALHQYEADGKLIYSSDMKII